MSDLEVLDKVIKELDSISVPTGMIAQIGVPLYNANTSLKGLYKAIVENIKKGQKTEQGNSQDDDIQLSVSPAESVTEVPTDAEELVSDQIEVV